MTKDLVIIVLGLWTALLPFLGLPAVWDRGLLLVSGFTISLLMFLLRRDFFLYVERLRSRQSKRESDTYVENGFHVEEPAPRTAVSSRRKAAVREDQDHALKEPESVT